MRESSLLGRGYHVFCDRFSLSLNWPKLYELNQRTFLTGTIRSNRRLPATIKDANVDSGTTHFMWQDDHLLAAHNGSNSRRPVRLFSTAISADSSEGMPQIIKPYNSSMDGVDDADMQLSFYSNTRKSLKVWKKWPSTFFNACCSMHMCCTNLTPQGKWLAVSSFARRWLTG